jgi:hypothetical protein
LSLGVNQKTITSTPKSKPKGKYKHTIEQPKRQTQTHPIENQETNTNTPLNKPKEKYKHILEQAKRQIQKHLRAN